MEVLFIVNSALFTEFKNLAKITKFENPLITKFFKKVLSSWMHMDNKYFTNSDGDPYANYLLLFGLCCSVENMCI